MNTRLVSTLALLSALTLTACAETRVTDRAAAPTPPQSLGSTLLVVETALPADTPERERRAAEAERLAGEFLSARVGGTTAPAPDAALAAEARARGLSSVSVVRIEDYARRGNLHVALAVPPVSWDTRTEVTTRLRVIDVASGTTASELRRDRTRGGLFALRSPDDLPGELAAMLDSLFAAD